MGAPLPRDLWWQGLGGGGRSLNGGAGPPSLWAGAVSLSPPSSRGRALIASFRGLCSAHSFILGPTQCGGEGRSDFQPSALDFLSFVGWRTDYATRLPVISALGVPAPWRRSALGGSGVLLGGEDESLGLLLDAEDFSRSSVIDTAFSWHLNSDGIPEATCNTAG